MYTGYFRPDAAYPSQIVGVAWLDQSLTATRLIAGTREPTVGSPGGAQVPAPMRATLLAAFNSGWKMKDTGAWGSPKNQFQYTWRSGVGTDRSGNLVHVGGDKLTLAGLARAMAEAGVQRGMELDIHPGMVTFTTFHPAAGAKFGLAAAKLLPDMLQPATHYLTPTQRDFFAVGLRRGGVPPAGTAR